MNKVEDVFKRLYEALDIKKDSDFCRKYGIHNSTLSTWKKRNSLPYEQLEDIVYNEKLSFDWLLTGKGDKKLGSTNENIIVGNITQNGNNILQTGNGTNIALLSSTSIDEICDLIKNYATPKILIDLKHNLQKIKEAHPL